jgi:hypothetical protein
MGRRRLRQLVAWASRNCVLGQRPGEALIVEGWFVILPSARHFSFRSHPQAGFSVLIQVSISTSAIGDKK